MTRASDALSSGVAFLETYFTDDRGRPIRLSAGQRFACDQIDAGLYGPGLTGYAVELHRGAGKSMLMKAAVIRAILRSFRYPVILTAGSLYEQFSRDIASIVTGTGAPLVLGGNGRPLLLTDHDIRPGLDYPDRKNRDAQLWNVADRLIYVGGWAVENRRRISVRGMSGGRGSVRGLVDGAQRPDLLVVDDPMKEVEADNARITEDTKAFVKRSFIPCGAPNARIGLSGTPYNDRDLITEAAGNASTKPLETEWPALARACLPAIHPVSGALCSAHWTRAKLDERRALIGSRAFAQEYLLDPQGGGVRFFEAAWIERWMLPAPTNRKQVKRRMFCDPSLGRRGGGDPSAIVVVDVDGSDVTWVKLCDMARRRPQKLVSDYLNLWERWQPDDHAIEDEGAQELLIPIFTEEVVRRKLPLKAIPRLQSTGGVAKVTRIKRLSPAIEFGRIRWDDVGAHRDLRVQAVGWGGTEDEPDDALDALEAATRVGLADAFTGAPGGYVAPSMWDAPG